MGLSASSLNPISSIEYRVTTPQAYNVSNESEVSDSFVESLNSIDFSNRVDAAAPVQYATASVTTNRINQIQKNQEVNQAYNDIAASFGNQSISYGANSKNSGYELLGSQLDLYA
ncbi:MAG: hypothetical protein K6F30_06470 [Lachnospiraceae bacterium]|nr:hypothetical protein [Lachnospiraceae bacterium]